MPRSFSIVVLLSLRCAPEARPRPGTTPSRHRRVFPDRDRRLSFTAPTDRRSNFNEPSRSLLLVLPGRARISEALPREHRAGGC